MFDLPEPLGPTTTATPGSRRTSTGSGNDLKPRILTARRCKARSLTTPTDAASGARGQLQAGDALKLEPDASLGAHDPQEHRVAAGAAPDDPGCLRVDHDLADLAHRPARA